MQVIVIFDWQTLSNVAHGMQLYIAFYFFMSTKKPWLSNIPIVICAMEYWRRRLYLKFRGSNPETKYMFEEKTDVQNISMSIFPMYCFLYLFVIFMMPIFWHEIIFTRLQPHHDYLFGILRVCKNISVNLYVFFLGTVNH